MLRTSTQLVCIVVDLASLRITAASQRTSTLRLQIKEENNNVPRNFSPRTKVLLISGLVFATLIVLLVLDITFNQRLQTGSVLLANGKILPEKLQFSLEKREIAEPVLSKIPPENINPKNTKENRKILMEIETQKSKLLVDDNGNNSLVLNDLIEKMTKIGEGKEALRFVNILYDKYNDRYGSKNIRTIDTLQAKAYLLFLLGNGNESLKIYEIVLKLKLKLVPETHCSILKLKRSIILVLNKLKKYEESLVMNQELLEAYKKLDNNEATIRSLAIINDMGGILRFQNKLNESYRILLDLYGKCRTYLGEYHLFTLNVLNNIALSLFSLEQYDATLSLANVLIAKINNENDFIKLSGYDLKARCLEQFGNFDEALEIGKYLYKKRKELLGENNQYTIDSKDFIAEVEIAIKERKRLQSLTEFLDFQEIKKLTVSKILCDVLNEKVEKLINLDNFKKANELNEYVLKERTQLLGLDDKDTMISIQNKARLLAEMGRPTEALEIILGLIEKRRSLFGVKLSEAVETSQVLIRIFKKYKYSQQAQKLEIEVNKLMNVSKY